MTTAHDINREIAKTAHEAEAFLREIEAGVDESRAAELEESFDKAIAHADKLRADKARTEKMEALSALREEIEAENAEKRPLNFRSEDEGHEAEIREFNDWARGIRDTQASSPGSAGGYLIGEGMGEKVIAVLKASDGLISAVNVKYVASGEPINYVGVDNTARRARQIGENTQQTANAMAFTNKLVNTYTFTTDFTLVPNQLLTDSRYDLSDLITSELTNMFESGLNYYGTIGTGSGTLEGLQYAIANSASNLQTSVSNTVITYDDLLDVRLKVNRAYYKNAKYMMSTSTLNTARKAKDGDGTYVFRAGDAGDPDRIAGFAVCINDDVPDFAANATSILFGDFSAAYNLNLLPLNVVVARERYIDYLQTGFMLNGRASGAVTNLKAVAGLKIKSAA